MGFDKRKLKKVEQSSNGHDTTVYLYANLSVVVTMDNPAPGMISRTISIAAHGSEKSLPREEDVRGILETLGIDLRRPIERGFGLSIGPCPLGHRFYYTQSSPINTAV